MQATKYSVQLLRSTQSSSLPSFLLSSAATMRSFAKYNNNEIRHLKQAVEKQF